MRRVVGGVAAAFAVALVIRRRRSRSSTEAAIEEAARTTPPLAVSGASPTPHAQLAPVEFERAEDASRVARRIESVLSRRTNRVIVVLERLVDGHNFSAIFRTCEALGVQNVWLISPPDQKFSSAHSNRREWHRVKLERFAQADARRQTERESGGGSNSLTPGSRRSRQKLRAQNAWGEDEALDEQHSALGRGAARFLSLREFDDAETCFAALKAVPECEIWATDLGQGAEVLAPDAPWLNTVQLPHRVALVIGTESNGVSQAVLKQAPSPGAAPRSLGAPGKRERSLHPPLLCEDLLFFRAQADRRIYLPLAGFSDSLNVGCATALALAQLLSLLDARGDLAAPHAGRSSWIPTAPDELRRTWASHLARDDEQRQDFEKALLATDRPALLDDLRRPDEFRAHTGKIGANCRKTRRELRAQLKAANETRTYTEPETTHSKP